MSNIIPRGTVIPAQKSSVYTTSHDSQTTVSFPVFEGERPMTKDNHKLGEFSLTDIPPASKGVPQFEVTFKIDENSIMTVTATDKGTNKKESITITNEKGRLSKEEIEQMIKDSEKYAEEDKRTKERLDAKHTMDNYIESMQKSVDDPEKWGSKLPDEDRRSIKDALSDARDWYNANSDSAEKDEYDEKLKEIQAVIDPIVKKLYGSQGSGEEGEEDDEDAEFEQDL
jgi:heat shock protein 5